MNRSDKTKPPRQGMILSDKHQMWIDPDTRSAERRAKDEKIARDVEADQERIQATLRQAEAAQGRQAEAIEGAAQKLAINLLSSLIDARKQAGLSQSEVSRRMGVPQSAIVRLESGTHSPTLSTLSRYAAALGVRFEVRCPA